MDIHSLVAANLPLNRRPTPMDAAAEELYFRGHDARPLPKLGVLVPIATALGVILLVAGIAQA